MKAPFTNAELNAAIAQFGPIDETIVELQAVINARDAEILKLTAAILDCADHVETETAIAPKAWERSDDYASGWLDCREHALAVIRSLLNGSAK